MPVGEPEQVTKWQNNVKKKKKNGEKFFTVKLTPAFIALSSTRLYLILKAVSARIYTCTVTNAGTCEKQGPVFSDHNAVIKMTLSVSGFHDQHRPMTTISQQEQFTLVTRDR